MLESTRKKEEDVKRETTEQLDLFRRQQEKADKLVLDEGGDVDNAQVGKSQSPETAESQWAVISRKRKRLKDKEGLRGVKIRKSSSTDEPPAKLHEDLGKLREGAVAASSAAIAEGSAVGQVDSGSRADSGSTRQETSSKKEKLESPKGTSVPGLGLTGYSSDEED